MYIIHDPSCTTIMALGLDDPAKGFVVFAADIILCDDDGNLLPDAADSLKTHVDNFYSSIAGCEGCWGTEFLFEGSPFSTPLFFVIDPYGDCLSSLLSCKDSEQAFATKDLDEALACSRLAENRRVFACIGFVFEDQFIEIEDFNREVNGDGENMGNLPSISRNLAEGIEVYLKQPEGDGDPGKVLYCAWNDGEIEEEDSFEFVLSDSLSSIIE